MGIIRGSLLVICSVLLLFSLIVMNLFWTLSLSLNYNNVEATVPKVIKNIVVNDAEMNSNVMASYDDLQSMCADRGFSSSETFILNLIGDNKGLEISCQDTAGNFDEFFDKTSRNLVNTYYYYDYDCDFLSCVANGQVFVLFSKTAKDYWQDKFFFMVWVSLALVAFLFLLAEKKRNFFFLSGIIFILSSVLFSNFAYFLELFLKPFESTGVVFAGVASSIEIFKGLFSYSFTVFLISFAIGVALIFVGIFLKLMSIGFKISRFFERNSDSKEESKKDIKEEKKPKEAKQKKEVTPEMIENKAKKKVTPEMIENKPKKKK